MATVLDTKDPEARSGDDAEMLPHRDESRHAYRARAST